MRLGILSDTHDQVERTRTAVDLLARAGADVLIHCGDITIPDVIYELSGRPTFFVLGNCDEELDLLRRAIGTIGGTCLDRGGLVDLGGVRVAVTHGHLGKEWERLEAESPDYFFSGHTHQAQDVRRGATRFINPGALHRASTWTVALLHLPDGKLDTFQVEDHRQK